MTASSDLSNIVQIVDASAAIAAAYVSGVRAAFGVGAGDFTIPTGGTWNAGTNSYSDPGGIWAGRKVQPFMGNIAEPFTHVSDMPAAPKIINQSAQVSELNWLVPMRFYVDKNEQGNARLNASPFYSRYLLAFAKHAMILGTCNSAEITGFDLFHDRDGTGFVGISMVLSVWERLDIGFEP